MEREMIGIPIFVHRLTDCIAAAAAAATQNLVVAINEYPYIVCEWICETIQKFCLSKSKQYSQC